MSVISQTTNSKGQKKTDISQTTNVKGQKRTDLSQTTNASGQKRTDLSQTTNVKGQKKTGRSQLCPFWRLDAKSMNSQLSQLEYRTYLFDFGRLARKAVVNVFNKRETRNAKRETSGYGFKPKSF